MNLSIQTFCVAFMLILSSPAFSGFDTSNYDSEVSNYIVEVYERFNGHEMSQKDFEKFYRMVVKEPNVEQIANVTEKMHQEAMAVGNGVSNYVFVVSLQRLVMGQNPRTLSYGHDLVKDLVLQLDSDQITQADLLKKTLKHEMALERLGELLTGQIQSERFSHMKVSQNN